MLGGWQHQTNFEQQYLENRKSKKYFHQFLFEIVFNKLFKDIQVDTLCTFSIL